MPTRYVPLLLWANSSAMTDLHSNPAISLLSRFDRSSLNRLSDFLRSPYHNKSEQLIAAFDYLREYHPEFQHKLCNKQALHERLFTQGKADHRIRNVLSRLTKLITEFIGFEYLKEHPASMSWIKVEGFQDRSEVKMGLREIKSLHKLIEEDQCDPLQQDFLLGMASRAEYSFLQLDHLDNDKRILSKISRDDTQRFLTQSLLLNLLYECSIRVSTSRIIDNIPESKYGASLISLLLPFLDDTHWFAKLTKLTYEMTVLENEASFHEAFKLLQDLPPQESVNLSNNFTQAANYCVWQLRQGNRDYYQRTYDVQKLAVQRDCVNHGGYMRPVIFINQIQQASNLDDHAWGRELIDTYAKKLHPNQKENAIAEAEAYWNIAAGNYDSALSWTQKLTRSGHTLQQHSARNLEQWCFYHLNELPVLESLVENARKSVAYHEELSEDRRLAYRKMGDHLIALLKHRLGISSQSWDTLANSIRNDSQTSFRIWLNREVDLIESKL